MKSAFISKPLAAIYCHNVFHLTDAFIQSREGNLNPGPNDLQTNALPRSYTHSQQCFEQHPPMWRNLFWRNSGHGCIKCHTNHYKNNVCWVSPHPNVWLGVASGEAFSWDLVSVTLPKGNSEKSVPWPLRLTCPLAIVNWEEEAPGRDVWKWDRKFWSKVLWKVWSMLWDSPFLEDETCSRKSSVGDTAVGVVSSPEKENECWESPTRSPKWGFSKVDLRGELIPDLNLLGEGNCFSVENKGCPERLGLSVTKLRLWLLR